MSRKWGDGEGVGVVDEERQWNHKNKPPEKKNSKSSSGMKAFHVILHRPTVVYGVVKRHTVKREHRILRHETPEREENRKAFYYFSVLLPLGA